VTTAIQDSIEFDAHALRELAGRVSGRVLTRSDSGYDEARKVWNGLIDRRPLAIVRAADELDVQAAVRFAREHRLALTVKGGGHNVAGHAVGEGALMLDMGPMNAVEVDVAGRFVRVQGGALWRDVDAATARFGLATTGGVIPSTGVAGLTLGGGIGWLVGRFGMVIDNLRSVTMVTADGEIVTASDDSHPDLFWAVRGGGGNFGVALSFDIVVHPLDNVLAGVVAYPASECRAVLEHYREFVATAPDELTAYAEIATDPESGMRVVGIAVCWPGGLEDGERVLAPLRAFGEPLVSEIGPTRYMDWQMAFEHEFPHGRRYYWKSALLNRLDDQVVDALEEHACPSELPWTIAAIEWYRGPMNRVDSTATAFPHRSAEFQVVASAGWDDPADDAKGPEWAGAIHRAVAPVSLAGTFHNFDSWGERSDLTRAQAAYGSNLDRLWAIKRRYDPDNVFSGNTNIPPAD
jgi:FAD/FMN-containing dehydrogenase